MPAAHLGNGQLFIGIIGKVIQHPAAVFLQLDVSGVLVEGHDDEGNTTLLNNDICMNVATISQQTQAMLLHAWMCKVLAERRNKDTKGSLTIAYGLQNLIYNNESIANT